MKLPTHDMLAEPVPKPTEPEETGRYKAACTGCRRRPEVSRAYLRHWHLVPHCPHCGGDLVRYREDIPNE